MAKSYRTQPFKGPLMRISYAYQLFTARAVEGTTAENAACPYSGKPVTHVLELDGRRFGFCNAFCRDKTVADAEAWPKFMALYHS